MNAALAIDEASVERAALAVMAAAKCDVQVEDADCAHVDDSMPCRCRTKFAYCVEHDWEEPQDPSVTICPWAARIARAALAAAPGDAETERGGVIDGERADATLWEIARLVSESDGRADREVRIDTEDTLYARRYVLSDDLRAVLARYFGRWV